MDSGSYFRLTCSARFRLTLKTPGKAVSLERQKKKKAKKLVGSGPDRPDRVRRPCYQHLLVSSEELLSLRLSNHFALVVGCINNN